MNLGVTAEKLGKLLLQASELSQCDGSVHQPVSMKAARRTFDHDMRRQRPSSDGFERCAVEVYENGTDADHVVAATTFTVGSADRRKNAGAPAVQVLELDKVLVDGAMK